MPWWKSILGGKIWENQSQPLLQLLSPTSWLVSCHRNDRKELCSNSVAWTNSHLKNISQIGSSPQVGVKIKNLWNHHLGTVSLLNGQWSPSPPASIDSLSPTPWNSRNDFKPPTSCRETVTPSFNLMRLQDALRRFQAPATHSSGGHVPANTNQRGESMWHSWGKEWDPMTIPPNNNKKQTDPPNFYDAIVPENPGCSRTKSKLRKGFTKAPDHLTVHLIPQLQGSTHHRRLREALISIPRTEMCDRNIVNLI